MYSIYVGAEMGPIVIGTSGYLYLEWIGHLYPVGTRQEEFMGYYAQKFHCVELNYTRYQMPKAGQLERMIEAGGPNFTFTVKANETLTQGANPTQWQNEAKTWLKAMEPLRKSGHLEAILFQFPHSYCYTSENRRHLDRLLAEFTGIPSAVEFNNAEWGNNRVIEGLKTRGVAYVCTDLPDLPGLPPVLDLSTSSLAYFRLHGRNSHSWWGSDSKSRYDYLYSEQELESIAERIKRIAAKANKTLVFFNNHARGQALKNANAMAKKIGK
jgi:uncharacterized protein YecE (DUF72 family)